MPNCWMMYWLPVVASPMGCHRHGGGATEMGTCAEPAPTSPFRVIRLLSRIEQSLPLQPTPDPAPAGAANLRAFDAAGDNFACETNEIIVSALCKDGGTPVLQGGDVSCKGATGIVGLCLRK